MTKFITWVHDGSLKASFVGWQPLSNFAQVLRAYPWEPVQEEREEVQQLLNKSIEQGLNLSRS